MKPLFNFEFVEGNQNRNPEITGLEHLQLMLQGIKEGYNNLIGKLEQENAELKAQLTAKNELLSNTEQLPVYDAQKAIDILATHFPEVLKNYFA